MKDKILDLFKKPKKRSVTYYNEITRPKANSELANFMFKQSITDSSEHQPLKVRK